MDSQPQLTMIADCDINRGMRRRELNFFLAGAALIGVLWGGYRVGRSIIHIGHEYHGASAQTPGSTTAHTGTNAGGGFNSLSLDVRIALLALAALVVATILGAVIGTVRRHRDAKRRRQRYYF
jgi:hypothetical protein